ncbi:hypothetical protein PFICI_01045 [Pestalotiopsis fici W106-1]|uniref:WSC domain-containing protein n=1 Tax=Pestalotiopsis fici (strain W106-1 / CGMCC3.15140) TaxID=1229662 RepID=W3XNY6_PESFW|nr:uncharacterized protein PFICI_01045 [Pestalotiopsis fici W106-1]ETS87217.1 hypothetical protein PFICI_01045 [Pestalotiopsis fici W106-1]
MDYQITARLRMAIRLFAIAVFVGLVQGQGFYLEPFTCTSAQNWVDLGCYDATGTQPFTFAVQNGYKSEDPSRAYANYNIGGNNINSTVTPNFCTQACRAHGFRYASLYDRQCRCGTALGTSFFGKRSSDQTCYSQTLSTDATPCSGDRSENCGQVSGNTKARIFVDPSFEAEQNPASIDTAGLASSYGYLGCFNKPNLPSDDPNRDTLQASPQACFENCARYGFPLTYGKHYSKKAKYLSIKPLLCQDL